MNAIQGAGSFKPDGRCKSCGTPMKWVITVKNKRMPLDPDPVDYGNVYIIEEPEHGPPVVGVALQHSDIPDDVVTYVSHFVTCIHADQHRRRGKKR